MDAEVSEGSTVAVAVARSSTCGECVGVTVAVGVGAIVGCCGVADGVGGVFWQPVNKIAISSIHNVTLPQRFIVSSPEKTNVGQTVSLPLRQAAS